MAEEPQRFQSVTSVTDVLPKYLSDWAANLATEAAFNEIDEYKGLPTKQDRMDYCRTAHKRKRDAAADLGSEIHQAIEAYNLGKPMPPWPLPVKARMTHFEQFTKDYGLEVEAAETRVYSRTHGYAGTLDILGRLTAIDNRLAVIDTKSGKGIYADSFCPQLAAYANADFLVADPFHPGSQQVTPERGKGKRYYTWTGPAEDEIPMPKVEAGYILHLRDDGYDVYEITDLAKSFDAFLSFFPVDRWLNGGKNGVLKKRKPPVALKEAA